MRGAFVSALVDIFREDNRAVFITGDLGFSVLEPIQDEFPERFINAGIAEQNIIGIAAGMALSGRAVYVYSIAGFPVLRPFEQIKLDCAYHNANVKIISYGTGFTYGSLGVSHHTLEDIALIRALPNFKVFSPCDRQEVKETIKVMHQYNGPAYMRLDKGQGDVHGVLDGFRDNEALKVRDGEKVVIFATGDIISEALKARERLETDGIRAAVYSFPVIKPIDSDTIKKCGETFDLIVTLEAHTLMGGFGSAVAEAVCDMDIRKARLLRLGAKDCFFDEIGSSGYLLERHGLSAGKICDAIRAAIKQ